MDTESQRIYDRMSLHRLSVAHPDWKAPKLAEEVGRSERWTRKWLCRFKASETHQYVSEPVACAKDTPPRNTG